MQSGELIVINVGEAQIELDGLPIKMIVGFSDRGDIIVPCNPHHFDKLDWEVNHNILIIKWQVNGIREVKWDVWFYLSELQ
jgi:hypothetical protein